MSETRVIAVGQTVADGLGFAASELETALRVCWLPVLLLTAWSWALGAHGAVLAEPFGAATRQWPEAASHLAWRALTGLVPLLLTALYMTPLVRLAASGDAPSHRTVPNVLGGAELRWLTGSVVAAGGVYALAYLVVSGGAAVVGDAVASLAGERVAVFEEGSLHASSVVASERSAWAQRIAGLRAAPLFAFGAVAVAAATFAVQLRLFALPAFWAVGGRRFGGSLRAALGVSAGWNYLRLLAIVALAAAALVALRLVLSLVPMLVALALGAARGALSGLTALRAGGEAAAWVDTAIAVTGAGAEIALAILLTALGAALSAGVLGSILRRADG